MYLSKLSIHNFRIFSNQTEIEFSKGLNLLVGENGCGKSATIDAIRALLNESDFSRVFCSKSTAAHFSHTTSLRRRP